jgi:hypothetical protein
MEARKREGIGLSYRPARINRLAESILWNRFLGSIIKSLKIPSLVATLGALVAHTLIKEIESPTAEDQATLTLENIFR